MSIASTSFSGAAAAYQRVAGTPALGGSPEDTVSTEGAATGSFASMIEGAIDSAINTSEQGERASVAAIGGNGDMSQVITAVAEAELSLQTVVAIRDKVVQAYLDISRMPI